MILNYWLLTWENASFFQHNRTVAKWSHGPWIRFLFDNEVFILFGRSAVKSGGNLLTFRSNLLSTIFLFYTIYKCNMFPWNVGEIVSDFKFLHHTRQQFVPDYTASHPGRHKFSVTSVRNKNSMFRLRKFFCYLLFILFRANWLLMLFTLNFNKLHALNMAVEYITLRYPKCSAHRFRRTVLLSWDSPRFLQPLQKSNCSRSNSTKSPA